MSEMEAVIQRVTIEPLGSSLTEAPTDGGYTLTVASAIDFNTDLEAGAGGSLILGGPDGVVLDYISADSETQTITLDPDGDPATGEAHDEVLVANADGTPAIERLVWVVVEDSTEVPALTTDHDHYPEGDRLAGALVTVRAGEVGWEVVGTPPTSVAPIAGENLAPESVGGGALTPSAAVDFVNGRFEDAALGSLFPGWFRSWPLGELDLSRMVEVADGAQIAGTRSMGIQLDAGATLRRLVTTNQDYPVVPQQTIEVSAVVRASRAVAAASGPIFELVVHTSDGTVRPDTVGDPAATWQTLAGPTTLGTDNTLVRARVQIPAGHKAMRFSFGAYPAAAGGGWTLLCDEAHWSVADPTMTPHVSLTLSPAQTIGTGSFTEITNWSEVSAEGVDFDADSVTIALPGRYSISAGVAFAAHNIGTRRVRIRRNRTGDEIGYDARPALTGILTPVRASATLHLNAGDVITVDAFQDSGGDLALSALPGKTVLTVDRVGV